MDSLAIIALLLFVCAVSCGGWAIWAYLHREPEPRSYGDEGGMPIQIDRSPLTQDEINRSHELAATNWYGPRTKRQS